MADFYAPQFQNPDILGSFIRGRQFAQQQQLAPLQLQEAQQQVQQGALGLEQTKMALKFKQSQLDALNGAYNGAPATPDGRSTPSTQQGAAVGGASGGIQNGPQASAPQYNPADPLASLMTNDRLAKLANIGSINAAYSGGDPLKPYADAQGIQSAVRKDQQERTKLALEPVVAQAKTVLTSEDPNSLLLRNPSYEKMWEQIAPQMVLDPKSTAARSPQNIRAAAAIFYNQVAAQSMGTIEPIDIPHQLTNVGGANGQLLQVDPLTGKATEVTSQKLPTYAAEKGYDAATGKNTAVMLQTSPGGATNPLVGGPRGGASTNAGAPGGLGTVATPSVDLGIDKPTNDNLKAATFANYARTGISQMNAMEQSGYRMSPTTRTAVIDAAVNEDPGKLSQWLSQEALAHKLSPQDQRYMASLLPVLQAAGHSMAGARLTQSQMRTNFESLIPLDSKDAKSSELISANRDNLYKGLLAQSGSAAQMPEFKNTLGADRAKIAGQPTINEGATATGPGGQKIQFKNGNWVPLGR